MTACLGWQLRLSDPVAIIVLLDLTLRLWLDVVDLMLHVYGQEGHQQHSLWHLAGLASGPHATCHYFKT